MPYTLSGASNATTKTRRIEIRITEEERSLEQAAAPCRPTQEVVQHTRIDDVDVKDRARRVCARHTDA